MLTPDRWNSIFPTTWNEEIVSVESQKVFSKTVMKLGVSYAKGVGAIMQEPDELSVLAMTNEE